MDWPASFTSYLGEVYALGAAVTWAFALVLFKRSGESIRPLALNLFKNTVAIVLLLLTLSALPAGDRSLGHLPTGDLVLLAVSGMLGIALADSLVFFGLRRIGVGLVTIADCTYTPSVVLCAVLLHGESLTPSDAGGAVLVLSGVFLASGHKPPVGATHRDLTIGMSSVVLAIVLMAFGIVMVKPILEESAIVPATLVRLVAGNALLAAMMLTSRRNREGFGVFRPSRAWVYCIPASFLGSYLSMMFWIGGFKYASSATAATLNQTSTIFALLFAWLLLKEPMTSRKLTAAALAIAGVLVVTIVD